MAIEVLRSVGLNGSPAPAVLFSRRLSLALLSLTLAQAGCTRDGAALPYDEATSLYALVETIDGTYFHPPLGPEPAPTGIFDATLLARLQVVLEAEDSGGHVSTLATFTASTRPGLVLLGAHELYWMNVPAATYFTDPSLAYRFRALLDGREVGRSDMSSRVFEVLRYVPTLPVGVKLRLERRDAPAISELTPARAPRDGGALLLTVHGSAFASDSTVSFAGQAVTATKVSSTELRVNLPASFVASPGRYDVVVSTPSPGGGTSAAVAFEVYDPTPVLTTLAPMTATAGSPELTLAIDGDWFVEGSVVTFGGGALATTFVSRTHLTAALPSLLAGVHPVRVVNPTGMTSAAVDLTISSPTPVLSSITPSAILFGASGTLTTSGTGFTVQSGLTLDGAPIATTFVSPTALTAVIPSSLAAGDHTITVSNPAPGGGASAAATLTVSNPAPAIASYTPSSVTAGAAGFTLTLTGSSFLSGAIVRLGGAALATTFVSGTQLNATVPSSAVAAAALLDLVVTNPAPAAGPSATRTLTVNNAAPAITSLSPASATAGAAALTVTVNGTGFVSGAVASFGGTALATTFVSATRLTAAVPAALLAAGGSTSVTASNPAPTTGASGPATFVINNPAPTLGALTPASVVSGSGAFTLTIDGAGFLAGASATFNGAAVATTYVSATRVTAAIPAASVATSGTVNVTVTSPAPTTGASGALSFVINNPTPVIATLTPASVTAGATAFTLTVDGASFLSGAQITFGATALATTFVSTTRLTAPITAAMVASGGAVSVTVANPTPRVGPSAAATFTVAIPTDASYGSVDVLLHMEGANGSTSIVDDFAHATTPSGGAALSTAQHAFGTASMHTPAGGLLRVANRASDLVLTGPFTIELQYLNTGSTGTLYGVFGLMSTSGACYGSVRVLYYPGSGAWQTTIGTTDFTGTRSVGTSGWHHVALTRDAANVVRTFVDGVLVASASVTGTINAEGADFTVGTQVSCDMTYNANDAYFDEVRLTNGVARYTAAFTPPTAAFPDGQPTITAVTPASIPSFGGTITLTGTNFGPSSVVQANGAACTGLSYSSSTQLTCFAPAGAPGAAASVTVTSPSGLTATRASAYSYATAAAPTLTSISPASGSTAGYTLVTLTGTNFYEGAAVTIGGAACGGTSVLSSTSLTCTTSAHAAGAVSVVVTNLDNNAATRTSFYTYAAPASGSAPDPITLGCGTGTALGATSIATLPKMTGYNAPEGLVAVSGTYDGGFYNLGWTPLSDTTLYPSNQGCGPGCNGWGSNPISNPTVAGYWSYTLAADKKIRVGTWSLQTTPTYNLQGPLAPRTMTLYGWDGSGWIVLTDASAPMTWTDRQTRSYTVTSPRSVNKLCLAVTPQYSGAYVTIGVLTFTGAAASDSPPVVSSVSPASLPTFGGRITINGASFTTPMTVQVGSAACGSVTALSSNALTCTAPAGTAGTSPTVTVSAPSGTASRASAFTYAAALAPTISAVTPSSGPATGGTTITVTGTGFYAGATAATLGGVACGSLDASSSTSFTCTTPAGTAGAAVSLVVTNPDGSSATRASAFTYVQSPATLDTLVSATATGNSVTVTGFGYARSSRSITSGRHYMEFGTASLSYATIGVCDATVFPPSTGTGDDTQHASSCITYGNWPSGGYYYNAPTYLNIAPIGSTSVLSIALDMDARTITYRTSNNVVTTRSVPWSSVQVVGTVSWGYTGSFTYNFGAGPFTYALPSGYSAGF